MTNQRVPAQNGADPIPLSRIAFVKRDMHSYLDEFGYMATIPTGVFYQGGHQYLSPIIYSSGINDESGLVEDWMDYLDVDSGITQAITVGDFSANQLIALQHQVGTRIYPHITGDSSHALAARLAVSEWASSDMAVIALSKDRFNDPMVTEGSYSYQFVNEEVRLLQPSATVENNNPVSIPFTTTASDGWLVGSFNWTGTDILVHKLFDPNSQVIDYSVYSRMYSKRFSPRIPSAMPMQFWVPNAIPGEWNMVVYPTPPLLTSINLDCKIWLHPGFRHGITIPANANWLNVSVSWDNSGTDINVALVDPTGRMVAWAPTGSTLSKLGGEVINFPNPMEGNWTVIVAWMDATTEQNNINLKWGISTIDPSVQGYLESAANGAVIAALTNSPLLYASANDVPTITQWALDRLNVSQIVLVDPESIHTIQLENQLSTYPVFVNLQNFPAVSAFIKSLSEENDVVITIPMGDGDEFFAPAALAGAFHGAPVFSLCGEHNEMTTRAEETWAPYLIGPEIEVYLVDQYTSRTENGWYDERIPNKYSMTKSESEFGAFLTDRGAYNSTNPQSVVIVAPIVPLKVSFDRSLISHYRPGRIPAEDPASASIMINRAMLHRFLFLTMESPGTTLLTQYAYTYGYPVADNLNNVYELKQVEDLADVVQSAGFSLQEHIGINAVYDQLNSQVSLWLMSTHGTLTEIPTDPPERPNGLGMFSARDVDTPYGFETTDKRDADGNLLVNPYIFPAEREHHVIATTNDFEQHVNKMGDTIVHITACLLGGSRLPLAMMKRGAVGVIASPRTVYFTPAGLLELLFTRSLVDGNSTGESLRLGLRYTSIDYTDPWPYDPKDYANQHVLFGDPEIYLYNPATDQHISAVNPMATSFGTHKPGNGVTSIAAVGHSTLLPSVLQNMSMDYEFFTDSNFSDFVNLLYARKTVVVEPNMPSALLNDFLGAKSEIEDYIKCGGVMVVLGVSANMSWSPWPVSLTTGSSGSSVTYVDAGHPLLTTPETLPTAVNYHGYFSSVWQNFTVLATDGTHPIFLASTVCLGKIALTTIEPDSSSIDKFVHNAVTWVNRPAITLSKISLSEIIIWEGDRVGVTLELTDLEGTPVSGAVVEVMINETSFDVTESSDGVFTIILPESWTNGRAGLHSVEIHAARAGYDTLDIVLVDFIRIKTSLLPVAIGVGVVVLVAIGGYIIMKKRRGEDIFKRSGPSISRTAAEKRRKEDEKIDMREIFDEE